jgi:hypothetical protein
VTALTEASTRQVAGTRRHLDGVDGEYRLKVATAAGAVAQAQALDRIAAVFERLLELMELVEEEVARDHEG